MIYNSSPAGGLAVALTIAACGVLLASDLAFAREQSNPKKSTFASIEVSDMGSFHVNGVNIESSRIGGTVGEITVNQMYVQYLIPKKRNKQKLSIVMVHGSGHTAKTYETTPDGREGWYTYFARKGYAVYAVDMPGRARAGFNPTPVNQAAAEKVVLPTLQDLGGFGHQRAWDTFRFGPSFGVASKDQKFPLASVNQYWAQLISNAEVLNTPPGTPTPPYTSSAAISEWIPALSALLDKIGPAIVFVHSQSGSTGLGLTVARPNLVKALVAVEPVFCQLVPGDAKAFARTPVLTIFGDRAEASSASAASWQAREDVCRTSIAAIRTEGGKGQDVYLPDAGFRGNSHMLMMDTNNDKIGDFIANWLDKNLPRH